MELILIRTKVAWYSIIGPIYLMHYISKGFNTFQYFNLSYIGIFPSGLVIVNMNRLIAELSNSRLSPKDIGVDFTFAM